MVARKYKLVLPLKVENCKDSNSQVGTIWAYQPSRPCIFGCLPSLVKFIYSQKATKFCKIFTLLLPYVVPVKSKVKILQNCVAFSEYLNFSERMQIVQVIIHKSFRFFVYSLTNVLNQIHGRFGPPILPNDLGQVNPSKTFLLSTN